MTDTSAIEMTFFYIYNVPYVLPFLGLLQFSPSIAQLQFMGFLLLKYTNDTFSYGTAYMEYWHNKTRLYNFNQINGLKMDVVHFCLAIHLKIMKAEETNC